MTAMTERARQALGGMVAIILFSAAVLLFAKLSVGATDPVYHVSGTFSAAGQGLISGSDVKIHGVNIGKVSTVKLVNGEAVIRMTINKDETIPIASQAVIRPKTLFGEKFVDIDPGPTEASGPFLKDRDVIKNTLGGFEVERILTDAYPILKAIKPEDLSTVLSNLARGGAGTGANVNHSLQNLAIFATAQAGNVAETQQFLDDFAAVSDTLAAHADAVAAGVRDGHEGLSAINTRADEFTAALTGLSRLSGDLADLLEHNPKLLNKLVTEGGKTLDVLDAQRNQLPGVILGLRQFLQTLAEAGTGVPFGDGNLAKIKLITGGSCQHAVMDCSGDRPPGWENVNKTASATSSAQVRGSMVRPTKSSKSIRELLNRLVAS
jgi:phospholipid/cholesterol/gamma-HCH transport system substrate-binding protein